MSYDPGAFPLAAEVCVMNGNGWRYGTVVSHDDTHIHVRFQGKQTHEAVPLDQSVTICNISLSVEETLPRRP